MEVIDFTQFSERRAARGQLAQDGLGSQAVSNDRWAQLHAETPMCEIKQVFPQDGGEANFWSDLQFRLAYPTHRLRTF
jgi:hypothetical protein